MSEPAVLIATAKLRHGQDQAFVVWKAHHDTVVGKFPGFISSDIIPPANPDTNEWTIILNFRSKADLTVWQQSRERVGVVSEGLPLFEDGNFGEVVQMSAGGERPDCSVDRHALRRRRFEISCGRLGIVR